MPTTWRLLRNTVVILVAVAFGAWIGTKLLGPSPEAQNGAVSAYGAKQVVSQVKVVQANVEAQTPCRVKGGRPDTREGCTPGKVTVFGQNDIKSTICVAGYTTTIRPPTSYTNKVKIDVMKLYGLQGPPSDYELDHFVPLTLNGHPTSTDNLWAEAWTGELNAHNKDRVEVALNKQVCTGAITLKRAQEIITTDWTDCYRKIMNGDKCF